MPARPDFSVSCQQLKTLLLSPPAYAERSIDERQKWVRLILQELDRVEKGREIPAQEVEERGQEAVGKDT